MQTNICSPWQTIVITTAHVLSAASALVQLSTSSFKDIRNKQILAYRSERRSDFFGRSAAHHDLIPQRLCRSLPRCVVRSVSFTVVPQFLRHLRCVYIFHFAPPIFFERLVYSWTNLLTFAM
nr:MAG TPA: hypothetical protein [Caudoviricetes sp.]